ncbi:MAG: hypothetical protein MI741_17855 [Rhodospirillales bacterium]|nr:hypothetical protein [Rhodospirillales bacterium]
MRINWILFLAAALIFAASYAASAGQPATLPSGNKIEILAVGPIHSTKGWSGLVLKYQTQIPLDDEPRLRQEVDEVWNRFVIDVEREGQDIALIIATEPTRGLVIEVSSEHKFVFRKQNGSWRTIEPKNTTLTQDSVTQFVKRLDGAYRHNQMNALSLYLADDWTAILKRPELGSETSQTADRGRYLSATYATLKAASEHQLHREIIDISINGDVAIVVSRVTEELTANAVHYRLVTRSTNSFQLRDRNMLWTKNVSVVEQETRSRRH